MRVNFFEEYPTEENLNKVKLIDFDSTIFVASGSYDEFKKYKQIILALNPLIEVAYWPIIKNSYWVSSFSNTEDLIFLSNEIFSIKEPAKILIDLELPIMKGKLLYFKNIFSLGKNKKIIKGILEYSGKNNINIVTAEYPSFFGLKNIYKILGVSYDTKKYVYKKCTMFYTSMIKNKFVLRLIKKEIVQELKADKNLQLGLGTLAVGVMGNEPKLSQVELANDLSFAKYNNIQTVTIFRLGGIDEQYLSIIKKFI